MIQSTIFGNRKNDFNDCNFISLDSGHLGEVLIRCNNVLYVSGATEDDEEGEMRD